MEIYLDNAAATPVSRETLDFFTEQTLLFYANQEAAHSLGHKSRRKLETAEKELSKLLLGSSDTGVLWVNSGTEAINMAFSALEIKDGTAISTEAEHPALREALKRLALNKENQLKKTRISQNGQIDFDHLQKQVDKQTRIVAHHHVHNETGSKQDLVKIGQIIRSSSPEVLFIVDTTQSATKTKIPWDEAKIDIAFLSGAKIGAPGGAAVLYRKNRLKHFSEFFKNARFEHHQSSRPNPPLAFTLVNIVNENMKRMMDSWSRVYEINRSFRKEISKIQLPNGNKVQALIPLELSSPYILSLLFPGYQAEIITRMLGSKGVMVAPGSACDAASKTPSQALLAMGVPHKDAYGALRLSFNSSSEANDIPEVLKALNSSLAEY